MGTTETNTRHRRVRKSNVDKLEAEYTSRMPGVKKDLATAARESMLVRVARSIRRSEKLDGFVVGIGREWVLLALLDPNIYLDGHTAVRIRDVAKVSRRGGPDTFVGRALAARGEWPPVAVDVNLDSVADLIRTASDAAPLVTLHVEEYDTTVCFIGRPVRFGKRSVRMQEITPEATWRAQPTRWAFADVTRVEFGGRYEQALTIVGGASPA